jgi:hypothetical protein
MKRGSPRGGDMNKIEIGDEDEDRDFMMNGVEI